MDEPEDPAYKIRFLEISAQQSMIPASMAERDKALAILKIERKPNQHPLEAWTLAMCRENGLPEVLPAYPIGEVIQGDVELENFIRWLA